MQFQDLHAQFHHKIEVLLSNVRSFHNIIKNKHVAARVRELGLDRIREEHLFGCMFNYLFKPAPLLQQEIDKFMQQLDSDTVLIGIHMRNGGMKLDYHDPSRVPMTAIPYFVDCAKRYSSKYTKYKYFVASDSEDAKEQIELALGKENIVRVTNEQLNMIHIDSKTPDHAFHGFLRALLDFWILSMSKHLVISRSNYSELASSRSFTPVHKYDASCEADPVLDNSDLVYFVK